MEKYQAQKNNVDNAEDVPEKSQDEINAENNAKNLQNAADVAIATKNPYAMAAGYAVKAADKLTGGKATQMAGEKMNQLNKVAPGGKQVQDMSNKLSESGASDAVGKAASAKNGAAQGGAREAGVSKASSKMGGFGGGTSSSSSSSSGSSSIDIGKFMKGNPMQKYMLLGGVGFFCFFLFLLILLADPDDMNMSLTNGDTLTFTSNGVRNCTEDEIENNLIYVGDTSVININNSVSNDDIVYISSDSANLGWFNNTAIAEIETKLTENPSGVVVISLGLNDLSNIDNYINAYRDLITKYPKNVFITSINPVDESKQSMYTNIDIENFNNKLSDNFGNNYIDTYSTIGTINNTDGISYDSATYQALHSTLKSDLSTSGRVQCSTGLTDIVYYNQNDYTQSYGYGSTIKSDGCGPVAVAMVLSTLKNESITPIETAEYSLNNGFKTSAGTSSDLFPSISQHYGVVCDTISLNQESIVENLTQSKPIIMLVGPGIFTSRNHFIVLTGISSDGKLSIADPLSRDKSNQLWDINTIIEQGEGSSLWAFSI